VIDPLSGPGCDTFQVSLRVARGDHRPEFGRVFAEVVPERSKRGSLRGAPHLGKSPGQQRGRTKVFFKLVHRSVVLTTVSDRSAADDADAFPGARLRHPGAAIEAYELREIAEVRRRDEQAELAPPE
jgi:hypothetical protein